MLSVNDVQAPTPMDRADLLSHNITNGKWVQNRLNGAIAEGEIEQPRYKNINIWKDIRKPRYVDISCQKLKMNIPNYVKSSSRHAISLSPNNCFPVLCHA